MKFRRRIRILVRDGYRCHICKRLTDRTKAVPHPMAPTVDHLVPRAFGGGDDPSNLACAHFICNAKRRQFGTVQLQLVG